LILVKDLNDPLNKGEERIRLSKLQKWILNHCENKPINQNDVLLGFYSLDKMELELNELKDSRTEFYKLRSKIEYRKESVALAFSQLYLARLVKRKWGSKWMYIDEQIWEFAHYCDDKITGFRKCLREDKENILMKCTLLNYLGKKDSLLNDAKIMPSKDWNKIIGGRGMFAAKGQLCIVGSEMCYHVYPSEIMYCQIIKEGEGNRRI